METAIINGICRCCASEGAFKDIRSAYQWMGAEEIYADMLKECFDLSLWSSGEGDDGGICEVCVTQLRNASNFKKQVLHTEEQFKKHLHTRLFKPSIVKVELPANDGIDSDDNISAEEGYSGTDYEVSAIKVESPEESKPKKRSAKMSTRASTSRAKKAKGDAGESSTKRKLLVSKVKEEIKDDPETTDSEAEETLLSIKRALKRNERKTNRSVPEGRQSSREELKKHHHNLREILKCTNATPIFRRGGVGYMCSYCMKEFPDAADLKVHTLENHSPDGNTMIGSLRHFTLMSDYSMRLDVTGLRCILCYSDIINLEDAFQHLQEKHNKLIYTDIKSHIMPFKFDSNGLVCCLCSNAFDKFKVLQEHMHIHFRNYICNVCDAGFVNQGCLSRHKDTHKKGTFPCNMCSKVFDTHIKRRSHEKFVHTQSIMNRCGYCNEGFKEHYLKEEHLAKVHGVSLRVNKCNACDRVFRTQKKLRVHVKRDHLLEKRHKCTECDMKFFGSNELKNHMVKHTGVKQFQCDVCLKCYGRRTTLKEHMRIHNNDRRFKCEHCGQTFVQKCSWKGHMKSKHGEFF